MNTATPSTTVGLAGITGRFGRLLAAHLLKDPTVTLHGYSRDPSRVIAALSSSPRVRLFQGGAHDRDKIQAFVKGCDVVVCAYLGDDELMVDGQKALIDACEAEAVPRYIASDWALDYDKLALGVLFPKDAMKHVRAYLGTKEKVASVHILVGAFMDPMFSPIFEVLDPATNTLRYWGEGVEVWEATSYDKAAEYTAAVAVDRTAVGVQKFLGDRKNIKEIAASFENVYGIKPKLERLGSLNDLKNLMQELRAQHPTDPFKYLFFYMMYYWINGSTLVGPDVDNAKYPNIKPETWEDFMGKRSLGELPASYFALASDQ
ncbi:hypothetical protein B0H67DRAFT_642472 [Lasiosphaeris hirsuta]|uniref:NAD(P)-binding domain-containing protein n=1 Tax=Lasiosphaeris hirsuta TaxID=260670 RepID=A0AA40E3W9_9PEZI|nr:hypothetical protein B0H67DRAFT_642472 [Lasiosphaeris hirsuta]